MFILFPLFGYFIFVINEKNVGKKTSSILFDLALFSSLYLIIKYQTSYEAVRIMFLPIPLLIACLNKKWQTATIFAVSIGIYYFSYFKINIYVIIIEFLLYFIVICLLKKKLKKEEIVITIFAIIKIIFSLFESDYISFDQPNQLRNVIMLPIIFYFITHVICYIVNKSEKIMIIHRSIKEVENEKQVRDSLFKITHEIKNPIAVCKGYLDMIDINNNDHIKRYVPIIRQEIERTLTLMNDFMNLTKLTVEKRKMDLSVLLQDVSEIASLMSNNLQIEYIPVLIDTELYIDGDYDRLKQVFINIIKNASESIMKNKKGIIKFETKVYTSYAKILITDNGCGMGKEVLSKIGDPFYTTKRNGTGLGVKLSKEIIDAHNGELKYKSKIGVGTTAVITLPLKKSL
jgi:signal transduction histidine kinase